ncbi:MAG: beta-propeller domain-containing protein [Candidatus Melainabacteria bacterium]|nr:beta-propeller domain-containing protein [Candidatus Melainabacteria bacterium]
MNECAPARAVKLIKKKAKQVVITGPHSLSKQAWPPAIVPDHVDIDKKGYLCFSDHFGRFSIVDLRKAGSAKFPPKVIAELTLPCKRVLALKVAKQSYAYALAKEPAEGPDAKYYLIAIDLVKPEAPSVISRTELTQIEDADLLFADKDVLFVSGKTRAGEHLIAAYAAPGKRGSTEATLLTSISTKLPILGLDYTKRELIVLQDKGLTTQLDCYNMAQISSPQQTNSLEVKGCYDRLSRVGDTLILAGASDQSNRQMQATTIALKPAPHAVSTVPLDNTEKILSVTAQKGQYLALAKSSNGKLILNSLNIDKLNNLSKSQTIDVPIAKASSVETATLIVNGKEMYIASGWSGVQVLNNTTGQWSVAYNYKIPRLAAAGIATWGTQAVLCGAELMLYNIADPEHPQLVSSAPLTSSVRTMVGAGSFILCLEKESVTLRKMAELSRTLASVKVPDKCRTLTFDKSQHRAYAGDAMGKLTRIYPVKVFSDNLEAQKSFDLQGNFTNIEAVNGAFMAADIHEVALFTIDSQVKEVGRRKFENLAIRDICITDHNLLCTAVDQNSKGFLIVLSKVDKELNIEGRIELPHNGTALSATATRAVAVGRDATGKDLVTIIDITTSARPTVKASFSVLESASAVAVQSKIALVAGRGLEIVTL